MIILEDSNNKTGKHDVKHKYFSEHGIEVIQQRLPVGDYVLMNDRIQDVLDRKAKRGIPVKMMDLLGTYDVAIDTKFSIQELCGNVCGKQHDRFRDECILAQNNGIKLIILVENDTEEVFRQKQIVNPTIHRLEDLHRWVNPRLFIRRGGKQLYPMATKGITLMKSCLTMQKKYAPMEFLFCESRNSAEMIMNLLRGTHGKSN